MSLSLPKHVKHTPKHRLPVDRSAAPRRALRTSVVLTSVAAAATGLTVSSGVVAAGPAPSGSAVVGDGGTPVAALAAAGAADRVAERAPAPVSRSDRRAATDPAKQASLDQSTGGTVAGKHDLSDSDPREIGRALLGAYGFGADQWECLDQLFVSESNWRVDADNPTSSAYGIPQALTALHDLPDDYMTNAETQIRWGLEYIQRRYGSPCSAWSFKRGHNWY